MTIQEYLSEKSLRVLDSRIKERAVVENLRTSFFSSGYRPSNNHGFFRSEMDDFYRKTYLTLHQMESPAAKKWKEDNFVPVATSYYIDGLNKVTGTIFTGDNFTPSFFGTPEYKEVNAKIGGWYEFLQSWLLPNLIAYPNDFLFFDIDSTGIFNVSKIPFCEVDHFDNDLIVFQYGEYTVFSDRSSTIKVNSKGAEVQRIEHGYGYPMFMQLGGVLLGDYYASFFQAFIAHAEQFARINPQYYYELAKAFNMLVMAKNECRTCAGTGEVHNTDYTHDCLDCEPVKKCPTCKGKAVKTVAPSDIYEVAAQDFDKNISQNIASWISPNIDTIKIKQDEDRFLRKEMKESLYIERSGVNQSGESKKLDNYNFLLFVKPIANRLHSLAQFVAERAYSLEKSSGSGVMKYVDVSIVEPVELDYMTADDYRAEMEVSKSDKDLFRKYQLQNYAKTFPSDSWLPFISEVRSIVDSYAAYSDTDFFNMLKIGRISENDHYAHIYFDKVVNALIYDYESKSKIIENGVMAFVAKVESAIKAIKPKAQQVFDDNGNLI